MIESTARARSSVRIERWSPEPKVRGSNPLGRIEHRFHAGAFSFGSDFLHFNAPCRDGQEKISLALFILLTSTAESCMKSPEEAKRELHEKCMRKGDKDSTEQLLLDLAHLGSIGFHGNKLLKSL